MIQRPHRTYITELHHADFSKLADATVGRLRLEEELSQRHFFTSEELPHVADGRERSAPRNLWKLNTDSVKIKYEPVRPRSSTFNMSACMARW